MFKLHARPADHREEVQSSGRAPRAQLVGESAAMQRLRAQVARAADDDAPLLIVGETGAGKTLAATALHQRGRRALAPLTTVVCPGLVREAVDWPALLDRTTGGILFLDQVGDLPLLEQDALLATWSVANRSSVRLVSSTTVSLAALVARGDFRAELYAVVAATQLTLPTLRERPEDLAAHAAAFLSGPGAARASGGARRALAPNALGALASYPWPGNVRELENLLERLVVTTTGELIEAKQILAALYGAQRT